MRGEGEVMDLPWSGIAERPRARRRRDRRWVVLMVRAKTMALRLVRGERVSRWTR